MTPEIGFLMKPAIVECIREISKTADAVSIATSEHLNELVSYVEDNWSEEEVYFEFLAANERVHDKSGFNKTICSSRWFAINRLSKSLAAAE